MKSVRKDIIKSVNREMYEPVHVKMYTRSHNKTVKHLSERIYHQVRGNLFAELWLKIHNQVYDNILRNLQVTEKPYY